MSNETLIAFISALSSQASVRELKQSIRILQEYVHKLELEAHLHEVLLEFRANVLARASEIKELPSGERKDEYEIKLPYFVNEVGIKLPVSMETSALERVGSYGALLKELKETTGFHTEYRRKMFFVDGEPNTVKGVVLVLTTKSPS